MNKKPASSKASSDKLVKNIRRKTRQTYSAEENIHIGLADAGGFSDTHQSTIPGQTVRRKPVSISNRCDLAGRIENRMEESVRSNTWTPCRLAVKLSFVSTSSQ